MRKAFFLINFGGGCFLCLVCLLNTILPFYCPSAATPYSFLGGILFLPPSVAFAYFEWRAFRWKNRSVERVLGWFCLGLAAYGFLITCSVAFVSLDPLAGSSARTYWTEGCGLLVALYLGLCGWERVRKVREGGP